MVQIWVYKQQLIVGKAWEHLETVSWTEYEKLVIHRPGEGYLWKATFN